MKKYILFTIFSGLLFFESNAKHIVGGFMSYAYVSGTTYNVTLTVYRDCSNPTNPLFDGEGGSDGAIVGVFDQNNFLVQQLSLVNPDTVTIGAPINNPCLQIPPDICVQQGTYNFQVTLPSANEGYTIAYGRCCRNNTVTNVNNSGNTGADYWAYIPPSNTYHNNSPVFNSFPPIFICLNSTLVYNNSATDPDGDVLRYSLCTPYTDGNANNPIPNPPDPPPYGTIAWAAGYSEANLMGGVPLTIDSITGVLTGTPNNAGQFVVGVCVSEYRNGQLIATYLRDFQFNVTQCSLPLANIPSANINPSTGIGTYELNCSNYTVTFENNTQNVPPTNVPLIFQWDFGVPGSAADTSSLQYPSFTYPDTGLYLVSLIAIKGTDSSACRDTTHAYVQIYPTFITKFGDANVCQNEPAYFFDSTTSTLGSINQWAWNFGDGNTSGTENPSHLYNSAGTYTVSLIDKNTLGCADTATSNIIIYAAPDANFAYGPTCINTPVIFSDASSTVSSFLWSFGDGSPTTTQPSPVHTYNATGNYTVTLIATSANGCLDTVSQTITIHPLPVVSVGNDTTICPYGGAQLSASGGVSYLWNPTTGISDSTSASPIVTPVPPDTAVYRVFVTDQNQCTNFDSITIAFHPIPQINAGPDTSVCLNPVSFHDSVQLTATGGVSYLWTPSTGLSNPNIANPLAKPLVNTTYTVLGTDTNGCQLSDSLTVFVLNPALNLILQDSATLCMRDTAHATILNQGASSYLWSPNQYLTNDTSWNTGFYPPDTTNFILTVANYCYTKSDSILIIVWPLPILGVNPLDSICLGNSLQLSASNGVSYVWTPDSTLNNATIANPVATPHINTEYYVSATSQYGCVNTDSAYILVYLPSLIQVSPNIPFVCQNVPVQLSATGAYTYSWSPAALLSDSAIANPIARLQDTTTLYVTGINIHGCPTTDSLLLNVQLPVTAVAFSPYDTCRGIPIQLFASGGFYYSWSPATGLSNTSTSQPFTTSDTTITYIVKVSNDCFTDSAAVVVNIHQPPYADAGPDTTIWRDTYAQLHGTTTATTYFWNPSTWLDNANDLSTTASPPQTTWYQLFASDQFGCWNIDSVLITVEPHTILDIPTGFSPNGDGMNDVFHIVKYLNIDHLEDFSVFDRWGERVFSTDNINVGWDGTRAGKPSPQGVYVWMVTAVTSEGDEITRKGSITLIR